MTPTPSKRPLLPCPFCRGTDVTLWGAVKCWKVGCNTCTASGPTKGNQFRAITAWNIVANKVLSVAK